MTHINIIYLRAPPVNHLASAVSHVDLNVATPGEADDSYFLLREILESQKARSSWQRNEQQRRQFEDMAFLDVYIAGGIIEAEVVCVGVETYEVDVLAGDDPVTHVFEI